MYFVDVHKEHHMPDGGKQSTAALSVRVSAELIASLDRIATALDRPRSWVVVRGLEFFLSTKGREVLEDVESIAALRRGEGIPADVTLAKLDAVVDGTAHGKGEKAARPRGARPARGRVDRRRGRAPATT
jgi:predicted transcriptional regulator